MKTGNFGTAMLAAFAIAMLVCHASASRQLDMSHHHRASLRRLHGAADLTTIDKCTFKLDLSMGKAGSCIPNQAYLLSLVKFDVAYKEVDKHLLQETAMQLQCLYHGAGAGCSADKHCTDFVGYCGYTPAERVYNQTTEPALFKVWDTEHQLGICRSTIQTQAECKTINKHCLWGKESPDGMSICMSDNKDKLHYLAYAESGSELARALLALWSHCSGIKPSETGSCATGGSGSSSVLKSDLADMKNLTFPASNRPPAPPAKTPSISTSGSDAKTSDVQATDAVSDGANSDSSSSTTTTTTVTTTTSANTARAAGTSVMAAGMLLAVALMA